MSETHLTLEFVGKSSLLPPFSARECTQTLVPIPQAALRRTVNGTLVCVGEPSHRKFHSTIVCKDRIPPAFEGLWIGVVVKVGCLQYLTQAVPQGLQRVQLERQGISLHAYDTSGNIWPVKHEDNQWVSVGSTFPGGFITYRPSLMMMVKNYHLETDEWGLTVGWRLELEET